MFHVSDPPVAESKRVSSRRQPKAPSVTEVNQREP